MPFDFILDNQNIFLEQLRREGYSEEYIKKYRAVINCIEKKAPDNSWHDYEDVYKNYQAKGISEAVLNLYRRILKRLKEYEEKQTYPVHWIKGSSEDENSLSEEFTTLLTCFNEQEKARGIKDSSIRAVKDVGRAFLLYMQERNKTTLSEISDSDAVSYFLDTAGRLRVSATTAQHIKKIFQTASYMKEECQRIAESIPMIPEERKNIQYLIESEIEVLKETINNPALNISLRNKAIMTLLIYTGMRRSDIITLGLEDIDWKNSKIHHQQMKTGEYLSIPMTPVVGNSLYDYITKERPYAENSILFRKQRFTGGKDSGLSKGAINRIVSEIFDCAGIRQKPGDRRNPHLFRHHIAIRLLENSVAQPVITDILGHSSPDSLENYLYADLVHLKGNALSIENYPVSEEVFQ